MNIIVSYRKRPVTKRLADKINEIIDLLHGPLPDKLPDPLPDEEIRIKTAPHAGVKGQTPHYLKDTMSEEQDGAL